jgi:hypothetical protein
MDANPNANLPTVADTHVPVGSQVTITIGRNVGDVPMDDAEWSHFKALVDLAVPGNLAPSLDLGWFTGHGEWTDSDGHRVVEESAVRILISGKAVSPTHWTACLSIIADVYGQDAIAWSYGPNLLATR